MSFEILLLIIVIGVFWFATGTWVAIDMTLKLMQGFSTKKTKLAVLKNLGVLLLYLPTLAVGLIVGPPMWIYALIRDFWRLPLK